MFHFTKGADGAYAAKIDSLDQGASFAADSVQINGDSVRVEVKGVQGTFQGTLSADKTSMKGTWTQGAQLPLELKRMSQAEAAAAQPASSQQMLAKMVQSMGLPIDIEVPVALIPFAGHGGATNLVYELHITNLAPVDLKLERIEVLDGSASLAAFAGAELDGILQSRGGSDPANKHRRWVLLFSFAHSLKAPPFARTVNSRRRTNARGCRRRSGLRSAC